MKDKCPGLDGWTIEFFIHFFDLIKHDLLRMVEGSRISGSIHQLTSSTLIALIPKKMEAESFQDFRPISLCNISFKIISKIITERIKVTLSRFLTKDQDSTWFFKRKEYFGRCCQHTRKIFHHAY